jgi:hypothetical protein
MRNGRLIGEIVDVGFCSSLCLGRYSSRPGNVITIVTAYDLFVESFVGKLSWKLTTKSVNPDCDLSWV